MPETLMFISLTPELSPMRLEDWLRSGPACMGKLNWQTSPTCDIKPVSAEKDDLATCVKFTFAYTGLLNRRVCGGPGHSWNGPKRYDRDAPVQPLWFHGQRVFPAKSIVETRFRRQQTL
jgi:hypothetical protein